MVAGIQQFQRAFRVTIGDTTFDSNPSRPLRFAFAIERDEKAVPNNASVMIWNLAESTRAELAAEKYVPCRIEVGYQEELAQIFFGDLRRAVSTKNGPDWITKLTAGDGEKQLTQARIATTFAKGTDVVVVLKTLVKALGLGLGNLELITSAQLSGAGATALPASWTATGPLADELEFFTRSIGLRWSIQEQAFMVAKVGQAAYQGGPKITPNTGLVGAPRLDSDGNVLVRALMLPDLLPGRAFSLESKQITGSFYASHTKHVGDSEGKDWYVDVLGKVLP